jgi:hypothetical protein
LTELFFQPERPISDLADPTTLQRIDGLLAALPSPRTPNQSVVVASLREWAASAGGEGTELYAAVERTGGETITGWAFWLEDVTQPLPVEVRRDGTLIGRTYTGHRHAELSSAFGRPLQCGFVIELSRLDWDEETEPNNEQLLQVGVQSPSGERRTFDVHVPARSILRATQRRRQQEMAHVGVYRQAVRNASSVSPAIGVPSGSASASTTTNSDVAVARSSRPVKTLAYYLPQYYPFDENDEWWGAGFTEWANVVRAKPHYAGHDQPRIPTELGFYDLRVRKTRERQAELARAYGIDGFCYYYYWFGGRRIMDEVIDDIVASGSPDFPFCICWANETWSRRWDGSEHEVLISQPHDIPNDAAFIHSVLPLFDDPRYITVDGAPLLLVYRPGLLEDATATVKAWRAASAAAGHPSIHLCMVQTFGAEDPRTLGFDSACEFPPHNVIAPHAPRDTIGETDHTGNIYSYPDTLTSVMSKANPPYRIFPGVMTGWDNTPRRKNNSTIFHGASPEIYETWLDSAIRRAQTSADGADAIVFINAWNEWAEGAYLEPDQTHGRAYLEATLRAVSGRTNWRSALRALRSVSGPDMSSFAPLLGSLERDLEALQRTNDFLVASIGGERRYWGPRHWDDTPYFAPGIPPRLEELTGDHSASAELEFLHGSYGNKEAYVTNNMVLTLRGWGFPHRSSCHSGSVSALIVLTHRTTEETVCGRIRGWTAREDIAGAYPEHAEFSGASGFDLELHLALVPLGTYKISIVFWTGSCRHDVALDGTVYVRED